METRHAGGISWQASGGHEAAACAGGGPEPTGAAAREGFAAGPVLQLRGRGSVDDAGVPGHAAGGEAAEIERVRSALRCDPRGTGGLRLVREEPADPAGAVAAQIERQVGAERFRRVFGDVARFGVEGRTFRIEAPTRAAIGLIERRFGAIVTDAAAMVIGRDATVTYAVGGAPRTQPVVSPVEAHPPAQPRVQAHAGARGWSGGRVFRLEDFVVGESNRLAFTAVTQFADGDQAGLSGDGRGPGGWGGPLFLHGPCGVGKTHLLHGLAHRFRERHPGAVVRVVSGETFLNEFIAAVRHGGGSGMTGHSRAVAGTGGIERFRRQYRRCDLLCIDDVHLLASKQATQQELLHTFDQIVQGSGKLGAARIVLVCDKHPRELKSADGGVAGGFSPALVSRFLSGMVAGIEPPDAALREAAARMFAQRRGLVLDEGAIRLLVERTAATPGEAACTVRDIEGLITRIEAVHRLEGHEVGGTAGASAHAVSTRTAARALAGHGGASDAGMPARKPIRAEQIIAETCLTLGVERNELAAPTRHKRVVLARAMITHLCRELTTMSFPEIARAIGRPSHSTVITAHQRLAKQIASGEVYGIGQSGETMTVGGLARQLVAGLTRGAAART